jgi:PIN domain nuclease of toxin-antitoxin system
VTGLLLDTHVALWWLADDPRITERGRETILRAPRAAISAASTWEIAIKRSLGKLDLQLREDERLPVVFADQGFELLAVDHDDAWAVDTLPASRTDPFDRMLAATARRRGLALVTADAAFDGLGVTVLRP